MEKYLSTAYRFVRSRDILAKLSTGIELKGVGQTATHKSLNVTLKTTFVFWILILEQHSFHNKVVFCS